MSARKIDLLELSDSEKMSVIREAKNSLLRQVSEERFCREFAQIYSCDCDGTMVVITEQQTS